MPRPETARPRRSRGAGRIAPRPGQGSGGSPRQREEILPIGTGRLPEWRGPRGLWPGTARASVGRVPRSGPVTLRLFVAVAITGAGAAMPRSSAAVTEGPLASAVAVPRRAMTLDEALRYAREHQPSLQSALARVAAAAADTRIAARPVAADRRRDRAGARGHDEQQHRVLPRRARGRHSPHRRDAGAQHRSRARPAPRRWRRSARRQEIFDFGRIAAQAAVADVAYEGERYRADAERLRVELLVKEAYLRRPRRARRPARGRGRLQRARAHRDMAAAAVKSGLHAPIELTRAEADLTRFDVGRIRASGGRRTARRRCSPRRSASTIGRSTRRASRPPAARRSGAGRRPAAGARRAIRRCRRPRARLRGADAVTRAIAAELRPDLVADAPPSRSGAARRRRRAARCRPSTARCRWCRTGTSAWSSAGRSTTRWSRRGGRAAAARVDVARADVAALAQQETRRRPAGVTWRSRSRRRRWSASSARSTRRAPTTRRRRRASRPGSAPRWSSPTPRAVRTDAEIQLAVGQLRRAPRPRRSWPAVRGRGAMITMTTHETRNRTRRCAGSRRVPIAIAAGTVAVVALGALDGRAGELAREQGRARGRAQGRHGRRGPGRPVPPVPALRRHDPAVDRGEDRPAARSPATSTRCSCGPGDVVKRGQVIATLDCRNASASSKAVAMQARAHPGRAGGARARGGARRRAAGGRLRVAERDREARRRERQQGGRAAWRRRRKMQRATLEVNDCVLRAPFAGEIADARRRSGRVRAPGHGGGDARRPHDRARRRPRCRRPTSTWSRRRRRCGRRAGDERELRGEIARRSPAADLSTRTVHLEIDLPDPNRSLPVGTTAELAIDVGEPVAGDRDPARRGVGAGRQGDRLRRRRQRRQEGRRIREGRARRQPFVEPALRAGQPRRDRRPRAAQGRRSRRRRKLEAAPTAADVELAGSKP